jgi:hypothetical protein
VLTVVTGPPCSGKSTYAWSKAQPGDVVIDFDRIAQALGSGSPHDHPDPVRWVAIAARRAAVNAAITQHHRGATVWIVHTRIPQQDMDRYLRAGADVVTLDVDRDELHRRADAERPGLWHKLIDEWTPVAPEQPKTRRPRVPSRERLDGDQRRGRQGRPWRRKRGAVLAASDVCWICGHAGADSVDHVEALALGGDALDLDNLAPAHHQPCPTCRRRCNASRGAGRGRGPTDPTPTPIQSPSW